MRVGGQLHTPATLPPEKKPGTHCIGGWVGPQGTEFIFEKVRKRWAVLSLVTQLGSSTPRPAPRSNEW